MNLENMKERAFAIKKVTAIRCNLIVPEYVWLLKSPFNDSFVTENAYHIMLAEKTQNAKLHLQYDYNCTNHVGQD